ncbi:MAG TPA: cyclophilin-like fold protein [Pedobacter sp.]|nr:cyclophilin-like fold protein [Pedobacter sp.]
MKSLITIIVVFFSISACTASCGKDDKTMPAQNNEAGNNNVSATKMKITVGTAVFTATLYGNASANEFKARLPLTIDMKELNANEKYYDLSIPLPTNASVGGAIKAGDLTLYGNNVLVLFYKNFTTTYSYTKLGYIDNPTGLAAAVGSGNVVVKFENN